MSTSIMQTCGGHLRLLYSRLMIGRRMVPVTAGIVVIATAVAACSTGSRVSSTAAQQLSTGVDQELTLMPGQLLAATGGATPVAFAQPSHGKISYGQGGSIVYTPHKGFSGTEQLRVTTTDAVKIYAVDAPSVATVGGVEIQSSAYGSAIALVPGKADEVYGLTDRGPNVAGRTDNEKVLPVPDFHPQIRVFRLSDGTAISGKTITLSGPDGQPLVGLVNLEAQTGENLVTIDGKPLPPSDRGLDTEGLVALSDGTFWVSDEYGPFIVHFDANGKELERLSPFNGSLPRELSLRSANQGMEGLTITPDGSTLVGIMQSALKTPGLGGSAKSVPLTRIVTIDLATKAVKEYLYPLADPQKTKVAISEITALSNTAFLIDERDGELQPGGDKKIFVADISGATDVGPGATVPGSTYRADAGGLQVDGKPIETAIGVTTDTEAIDKLKTLGITVASKTPKLDLGGLLIGLNDKGEFFGHDKIEGLATPDGGNTLVIANDSDFGLAGIASETTPFTLEPKTLANGRPDTGEFLVVDSTELPARTQTATISIKVG
ncbi:esterase-like activity of phytase family protein [Nocardia sp. NPDC051787]|uniref:esterase-like activity of phytase family protein n=1 Tax=Nocardia sp. NPDC051787 TaxID=3155415 RepID=UPI003420AB74